MVSRIYKCINRVFAVWIVLILFGAVRSDNLRILGISKYSIGLLLLLISMSYFIFKSNNFKVNLINFLKRYKNYILIGVVKITIIYQILLITFMHLPISFDVFFLWGYLNNPINGWVDYFSFYPNNLFILFFLKFYTEILNISPTWLALDIINLIMVDLSAVFNVLIIKKFFPKKIDIAIFFNSLWLLFFPQILVPYTDTMVLPFISIYIYIYVKLYKNRNLPYKSLWILLFGFVVAIAYLMKPTSIIPIIAIGVLNIFKVKKDNIFFLLRNTLLFFVTFFVICYGFRQFTLHQDFVPVDYSKKTPAIHYINMGLHDETRGGYNNEVAIEMRMKPTQKEKVKYSIDGIKKQLKEKGVYGEVKSLINKNFYNTQDGTFGWNSEGDGYFSIWKKDHFEKIELSANKLNRFFENIYHINGKYVNDFKFWSQIIWIIAICLMLYSVKNNNDFLITFCKLSLIGGFTFLLIFEGGRTRYLIQFLPIILLLCTLAVERYQQKNLKILTGL